MFIIGSSRLMDGRLEEAVPHSQSGRLFAPAGRRLVRLARRRVFRGLGDHRGGGRASMVPRAQRCPRPLLTWCSCCASGAAQRAHPHLRWVCLPEQHGTRVRSSVVGLQRFRAGRVGVQAAEPLPLVVRGAPRGPIGGSPRRARRSRVDGGRLVKSEASRGTAGASADECQALRGRCGAPSRDSWAGNRRTRCRVELVSGPPRSRSRRSWGISSARGRRAAGLER